jgi:hypothetical protein
MLGLAFNHYKAVALITLRNCVKYLLKEKSIKTEKWIRCPALNTVLAYDSDLWQQINIEQYKAFACIWQIIIFGLDLIMYISHMKKDVTGGMRKLNYGELLKCISHKILLGWANQGNETAVACTRKGRNQKFVKSFSQKN